MILTTENKLALKRIKGEKNLNFKELAACIDVHSNTIRKLINSSSPANVKTKTFIKISQFISKNY